MGWERSRAFGWGAQDSDPRSLVIRHVRDESSKKSLYSSRCSSKGHGSAGIPLPHSVGTSLTGMFFLVASSKNASAE
jgi:hypothetical protein